MFLRKKIAGLVKKNVKLDCYLLNAMFSNVHNLGQIIEDLINDFYIEFLKGIKRNPSPLFCLLRKIVPRFQLTSQQSLFQCNPSYSWVEPKKEN